MDSTFHPQDRSDFEYDRLSDDQFRLLKITGSNRGVVEADLETHTIHSAPSYNALSYVWEPQSELKKHYFICNKKTFSVSPDLGAAFAQIFLWHKMTEEVTQQSACYVWNDFVCINQGNTEERGKQILRMCDIYQYAQRTIVWLGDVTDQSVMAMFLIPALFGKLKFGLGRPVRTEDLEEIVLFLKQNNHGLRIPPKAEELIGVRAQNLNVWEVISEFLHRPWFQRLWVIQEAVLAPEIVVLCGFASIDWDVLCEFAELVLSDGLINLVSGPRDPRDMVANGIYTIRAIHRLRKVKNQTGNGVPFESILLAAWGKKCLENVDRVWALIGLLPDFLRSTLGANPIDYSEQGRIFYWETFIKIARWQLDWDLRLSLLSMAACSQTANELPSWCPDWTRPPMCSYLGEDAGYGAGRKGGAAPLVTTTLDSEDEHPEARIWFTKDIRVIKVAGFRIDVVSHVTAEKWDFWPRRENEKKQVAQQALHWQAEALTVSYTVLGMNGALSDADPQSNGIPIPEAHWQTLAGGKMASREAAKTLEAQDYFSWLTVLMYRADDLGLSSFPKDVIETSQGFETRVQQMCQGRKYIGTMNGRVGLAPPGVEVNDIICILYGGWVPFIIRSPLDGGPMRLVGDAYVHDLMHGEALDFEVHADGPIEDRLRGPDELFPIT